ncbi:2492_t:CDS:2, partial [Paraglomus brasilianum]
MSHPHYNVIITTIYKKTKTFTTRCQRHQENNDRDADDIIDIIRGTIPAAFCSGYLYIYARPDYEEELLRIRDLQNLVHVAYVNIRMRLEYSRWKLSMEFPLSVGKLAAVYVSNIQTKPRGEFAEKGIPTFEECDLDGRRLNGLPTSTD